LLFYLVPGFERGIKSLLHLLEALKVRQPWNLRFVFFLIWLIQSVKKRYLICLVEDEILGVTLQKANHKVLLALNFSPTILIKIVDSRRDDCGKLDSICEFGVPFFKGAKGLHFFRLQNVEVQLFLRTSNHIYHYTLNSSYI
jgi:hypothetical protein